MHGCSELALIVRMIDPKALGHPEYPAIRVFSGRIIERSVDIVGERGKAK